MTENKVPAEFLNQRQASEYLDTSGRQLADLRKAALIPAYKIGNAWLYKKADLDTFKKEEEQRKDKLLSTPIFDNENGFKFQAVFNESDLMKSPTQTSNEIDEQFKEANFTSPFDSALCQVKCIRDQLENALGRLNLLEINLKGM